MGLASTPAAERGPAEWPPVRTETKPWTRWWWLGNILEEGALRSEMAKYAAAGLGGLEITPIYGVRGEEDRFLDYLSPGFMERFDFVLEEAARLGLGVDMATGNGWPFGGPWVESATACKRLDHRTWTLRSGETLEDPVRFVQRPVVRTAGQRKVTIEDLVEPVEANPNLQELALDQVRFEKELPLLALMAFSENGDVVDLTARVGRDGRLDWVAPDGKWSLHGLFQGWHGKLVERAGPGGEGNVIDHFSVDALEHYLARFDAAFSGSKGVGGLRAFFNDSYEVDDAAGNSDWTPKFLGEFEARRGYDLRNQLPALFGAGAPDTSSRVLSDYRETISDLLLERFTRPWREWAHGHGTVIRNQAHGSPANILDLYAASDIPEQEGSDLLAIKLASSAAHVTGKRLTSSEAATWIDEHFLGTLAEVKAAVDRFFLGGINHNCYHGTAFSPPDEPWPGFHFYASIELNPSNPIWRDFPVLNAYVARVQSFLQLGQPDEDVLLYFPIHDKWAERGPAGEDGRLQHFHGREREGMTAWRTAAQALLAGGIGFDAISDRQLGKTRLVDGSLRSEGGATYRAIVLPRTHLIPLESMQRLADLVRDGATVVVHGALPEDVPGFGRLDSRRSEFQALVGAMRDRAGNTGGVTTRTVGQGTILVGEDLPGMLDSAGIERERLVDLGLGYVRRRTDAGTHYFLSNRGPSRLNTWVPLRAQAGSVMLFDPMTGRVGRAASRPAGPRDVEVFLQLDPGASVVAVVGSGDAGGPGWTYWREGGEAQPVNGPWSVSFLAGGPQLPPDVEIARPRSWTEFAGDKGRIFAGTAVYRTTFSRPQAGADGVRIDLGTVAESARVRINGREVAGLIAAPYRIDLPADRLRDSNALEVEVTNLAANRIADLDRRGVNWKRFYNVNMPARRPQNQGADGLFSAAAWPPLPSGLLGPATLAPLQRFDPLQP